MKRYIFIMVASVFIYTACSEAVSSEEKTISKPTRELAKFEPEDGKVILFVGQELESIGGLEAPYNDGYLDHFPKPGGWTAYTNLNPGDTSFGYINKGLDGVLSRADWGDSPSFLKMQIEDPDYSDMAIAIGLSMVNHEEAIAAGERDSLITVMGEFFKSIPDRAIFLRIGYEFDGHAWNFYDRESYLKAYKRIKDRLDEMGVNNVAYVWQSTGWVSDPYQLEEWYPGDEYVDWCAYSFFNRWREVEMIDFARQKGKPVFIAEASATISDHMAKFTGQTKATVFSNEEHAKEAWEKWFTPFFKSINENPDVIKAFSYINCNWQSHVMWEENPTFQLVDARIQTSDFITKKWLEETNKDKYIKTAEKLLK